VASSEYNSRALSLYQHVLARFNSVVSVTNEHEKARSKEDIVLPDNSHDCLKRTFCVTQAAQRFPLCTFICILNIQRVPEGMCQTSGGCSLC
jgi:hypothetical protein